MIVFQIIFFTVKKDGSIETDGSINANELDINDIRVVNNITTNDAIVKNKMVIGGTNFAVGLGVATGAGAALEINNETSNIISSFKGKNGSIIEFKRNDTDANRTGFMGFLTANSNDFVFGNENNGGKFLFNGPLQIVSSANFRSFHDSLTVEGSVHINDSLLVDNTIFSETIDTSNVVINSNLQLNSESTGTWFNISRNTLDISSGYSGIQIRDDNVYSGGNWIHYSDFSANKIINRSSVNDPSIFENVSFVNESVMFGNGFKMNNINEGDTTRDSDILIRNNGIFKNVNVSGDVSINKSGITTIQDETISNKHFKSIVSDDEKLDIDKTKLSVHVDNKINLVDNVLQLNVQTGYGLAWRGNELISTLTAGEIMNSDISKNANIYISKTNLSTGSNNLLTLSNDGVISAVDMRVKPGDINDDLISDSANIQMSKTAFIFNDQDLEWEDSDQNKLKVKDNFLRKSTNNTYGEFTLNNAKVALKLENAELQFNTNTIDQMGYKLTHDLINGGEFFDIIPYTPATGNKNDNKLRLYGNTGQLEFSSLKKLVVDETSEFMGISNFNNTVNFNKIINVKDNFNVIVPSSQTGNWFKLTKAGHNTIMTINDNNINFEGIINQIGDMGVSGQLTVQNVVNTARSWTDKNIFNYTEFVDANVKFGSGFMMDGVDNTNVNLDSSILIRNGGVYKSKYFSGDITLNSEAVASLNDNVISNIHVMPKCKYRYIQNKFKNG